MEKGTKSKSLDNSKVKISEDEYCSLILFNDDINSFDFVVKSLIEVCNHNPIQAEQCTFIAHHKGKCNIKNGTYSYLLPLKDQLDQRGLTSTISLS